MTADRAGGPGSVTVELRLFGGFREAVGRRTDTRTYDGPVSVGEVLAELEASVDGLNGRLLDADGGLADAVAVVRNGRNVVHLDGVDTVLADGDELAVMPPLTGGARRAARPAAPAGMTKPYFPP